MFHYFKKFSYITLFCFIAFSSHASVYKTKVIRVIDGDTVVVLNERTQEKIRLQNIDAPEMGQPFGKASKQALAHKIHGNLVDLESHGKDVYGRTLGVLYLKGENINLWMVEKGYAWVYRRYTDSSTYLKLEQRARNKKLGLWRLPKSQRIEPWLWRKQERDRKK